VEGWTHFTDRYLPIGGILAPLRAVKKVSVEIRCEAGGGAIITWGEIAPPAQGVPVAIEITDERGQPLLLYTTSNAGGRFNANTVQVHQRVDPGKYSVQAFATAGGPAAEAESNIVLLVVKS
jgi:hypothetical protein